MKSSLECLALIKHFEGCRLRSYPDPGSGAQPFTIGFGATGADIGPGVVWDQQQADDRLTADVTQREGRIDFCARRIHFRAQIRANGRRGRPSAGADLDRRGEELVRDGEEGDERMGDGACGRSRRVKILGLIAVYEQRTGEFIARQCKLGIL